MPRDLNAEYRYWLGLAQQKKEREWKEQMTQQEELKKSKSEEAFSNWLKEQGVNIPSGVLPAISEGGKSRLMEQVLPEKEKLTPEEELEQGIVKQFLQAYQSRTLPKEEEYSPTALGVLRKRKYLPEKEKTTPKTVTPVQWEKEYESWKYGQEGRIQSAKKDMFGVREKEDVIDILGYDPDKRTERDWREVFLNEQVANPAVQDSLRRVWGLTGRRIQPKTIQKMQPETTTKAEDKIGNTEDEIKNLEKLIKSLEASIKAGK